MISRDLCTDPIAPLNPMDGAVLCAIPGMESREHASFLGPEAGTAPHAVAGLDGFEGHLCVLPHRSVGAPTASGPSLKIGYVVDDARAEFEISRPAACDAQLIQGGFGDPKVLGRLADVQLAGRKGDRMCGCALNGHAPRLRFHPANSVLRCCAEMAVNA